MTDVAADIPERRAARPKSNTAKRFAAERRFRFMGLAAVLTAGAFLVILLSSIVGQGLPAFRTNVVTLPLDLSEVDAQAPTSANYRGILGDALEEAFPSVSGRREKRALRGVLSAGADVVLPRMVADNPEWAGRAVDVAVPLSDTADLYFKGLVADLNTDTIDAPATLSVEDDVATLKADGPVFADDVERARDLVRARVARIDRRVEALGRSTAYYEPILAEEQARLDAATDEAEKTALQAEVEATQARLAAVVQEVDALTGERNELSEIADATGNALNLRAAAPSLLVNVGGGVLKAATVSADTVTGAFVRPAAASGPVEAGEWSLTRIELPEAQRKVSDREIVWLESLREAGRIESTWNWPFFTSGASREPEMAGIWGAIVGSFLTMVVTLLLSFPIGVAAAIYLEEFAPKNRLTDFIEVNINNLAAVPSIVFGLLGLALLVGGVNLGWFTVGGVLPRSAAVTGGAVLALMTLPTIIIASRAALKSVPPSIREAALGVGASRIQAVFHHVLPLAMPGILTGTIIGMAQALGETAPLLMIGMVAFIVDIPGGFTDPATVLPVQIYMWADFPEVGFRQKTAAAIMILLGFLVLMNLLAVLLRRRFERRW